MPYLHEINNKDTMRYRLLLLREGQELGEDREELIYNAICDCIIDRIIVEGTGEIVLVLVTDYEHHM